jgi:hypothetical protein
MADYTQTMEDFLRKQKMQMKLRSFDSPTDIKLAPLPIDRIPAVDEQPPNLQSQPQDLPKVDPATTKIDVSPVKVDNDALTEAIQKRPDKSTFHPSMLRKILAGVAGVAGGAVSKNIPAGFEIYDKIANKDYNAATRKYQTDVSDKSDILKADTASANLNESLADKGAVRKLNQTKADTELEKQKLDSALGIKALSQADNAGKAKIEFGHPHIIKTPDGAEIMAYPSQVGDKIVWNQATTNAQVAPSLLEGAEIKPYKADAPEKKLDPTELGLRAFAKSKGIEDGDPSKLTWSQKLEFDQKEAEAKKVHDPATDAMRGLQMELGQQRLEEAKAKAMGHNEDAVANGVASMHQNPMSVYKIPDPVLKNKILQAWQKETGTAPPVQLDKRLQEKVDAADATMQHAMRLKEILQDPEVRKHFGVVAGPMSNLMVRAGIKAGMSSETAKKIREAQSLMDVYLSLNESAALLGARPAKALVEEVKAGSARMGEPAAIVDQDIETAMRGAEVAKKQAEHAMFGPNGKPPEGKVLYKGHWIPKSLPDGKTFDASLGGYK